MQVNTAIQIKMATRASQYSFYEVHMYLLTTKYWEIWNWHHLCDWEFI
jgi:hypothetical protein